MLQLSKQERFQVTSKLVVPNSWVRQTLWQRIPNCWTWQRRRHRNQTCCDEHVVQSVDGQRQIADDGDRQRRRPGRNNQRGSLVLTPV